MTKQGVYTMTTTDLKQQLLGKAFGGVLYDVSAGSDIRQLLEDNNKLAEELATELNKPESNGIDKGLYNFIKEYNNA